MSISLAKVAPVALASLAYLQAKTQIGDDLILVRTLLKFKLRGRRAEARDRVNLFYTLEEHAKHNIRGKRIFLIYDGREWTFRETYDTVLRYATWMKNSYNIQAGEVVALDSMNTHRFIFVWLALWSLGAHPAFINYNLTGDPLLHSIRASSARLVLVDEDIKAAFTPAVLTALADANFGSHGPVVVVDLDGAFERNAEAAIGIREPDSSRSGATTTSLAMLIFTSGTTGLPKPAVVAWIKLYSSHGIAETWMGLNATDRFYTCMPLYHSTAAILGATPCLSSGTTLVLGHRFSNRTFWPDVRASRATIIQYVGETCRYLLAAPPQLDPQTGASLDTAHHVRLAYGNGMRPDVWERFKARFAIPTIAEFYSATEGAGSFWNLSRNASTAGAIGRFGLLGRIVSYFYRHAVVAHDVVAQQPFRDATTGFCSRVPLGTPGELLFALDARRPEASYQGYWNNESASAAKLLRGVFSANDAWFATGDLVREDANGCIWFCDRVGDTFRWKGENVSTSEVAEALGRHSAVVEANVYGVALPHHDGRAGCAAITLAEPVSPELLRDLGVHATSALPRYAVPLFLRVTEQVSATGNNKQQKKVLREEGAEPARMRGDRMFWLRGSEYVPFGHDEWKGITESRVKL